jgi:hypothetical protein
MAATLGSLGLLKTMTIKNNFKYKTNYNEKNKLTEVWVDHWQEGSHHFVFHAQQVLLHCRNRYAGQLLLPPPPQQLHGQQRLREQLPALPHERLHATLHVRLHEPQPQRRIERPVQVEPLYCHWIC